MTAKDLVESEEPEKKVTNRINMFSAINQALHTVLDSDPKYCTPYSTRWHNC